MAPEESDWAVALTPSEVARRLGIGKTKVFELLAGGTLESISIGRSRRVPLPCLASFVRRQLASDPGAPVSSHPYGIIHHERG